MCSPTMTFSLCQGEASLRGLKCQAFFVAPEPLFRFRLAILLVFCDGYAALLAWLETQVAIIGVVH